jgi:hypothetical protein
MTKANARPLCKQTKPSPKHQISTLVPSSPSHRLLHARNSEVSNIRLPRLSRRIVQLSESHTIAQLHLASPSLDRALDIRDRAIEVHCRRGNDHVIANKGRPWVKEVLEGGYGESLDGGGLLADDEGGGDGGGREGDDGCDD